MNTEDNKFQKPTGAGGTVSIDDFVVHVMPKEFLGRSGVVKQEVPKPAPLPPPVVIAQPATKPTAVVTKPKKKSKAPLLIFLAVILLIVSAGVSLMFLLNPGTPPVLEPVPVVTPPPAPVPVPVVKGPEPGVDTDSDGLTDMEEKLYGTDHRNPDTDNDSFLDGNEVFHRFDPLSPAPSTLLDTGAVAIYADGQNQKFDVYYPASWRVTPRLNQAGEDVGVQFDSPGATAMKIDILAMEAGVNETDWLLKQVEALNDSQKAELNFKALSVNDFSKGTTKEGYTAYTSLDQRTVFVMSLTEVHKFSYELGASPTIEYFQTFQMMINSFKLTE
ncbi:hypothetical protein COY25_01395 [Candidatus Uhrbacteria bacterium CG_4_10_14_0_2_um_filter_41_7]|uniref:Uncharacterized protein n=1 Tax=Candidatus Uhrbacteria bacterium CG_4_9_14_3_um_filter_41_35 TaxID=1975034 RepID=A0A2M7XEJ9_9BACT|nr:MAG: hypothetical protein COV92_02985 [Candidatus Uhrbacteria bacterium CG11_big_fil_rev_8_21_14_0_20_41_9]PIZ54993.1 MAG: hypothetical protein COY25_01395 [Candidatus Uhrbacteria bacterium CG_4_10_14_0_2_um_filter_41_7]PJA46291.1 MAG: hypothetical protein CO173_03195 [Candidatus Uhrbacteria bacterium CG_4_9_14_3_um_filter_41_35]